MFLASLLLLLNSALCMLRLGSAAFPRPLSGAEEKEYLDKWINGKDISARNKLVEHNLRLVTHIINNG